MYMKKLIAIVLVICLVLPNLYCVAAEVEYGGPDDDEEVKVFVDDQFSEPFDTTGERWLSGWDQEVIGGYLERDMGMAAIIVDNSDKLPMIFRRQFENMTYGEAFMNIHLRFDTIVNGAKWTLRCGEDDIMGFTTIDGNIAVITPDGLKVVVEDHKFGVNYNIKFVFNVDKQMVDAVYIDGKIVASNIPFIKPISKINNFLMCTENETVGTFKMDTLKIYRGYKIYEQFDNGSVSIPEDWENVIGVTKVSDMMLDMNSNQKVRKSYTRETRKTATEFYVLMPNGRNGFNVSINDGDNKVAGISTTKNGFAYFTGNSVSEEFYEQFPNVMYNFKLITDFENHSMDLYMNNRIMKKNIPLPENLSGTDNITIENTVNGESIYFTTVTVQPVIEYDDYCPEPQVPAKDDIDIIMQMCPMWSEGTHFGYDHLNASPDRKPLMGFYDESDPEALDWIIKYMVEHGVDVRMPIWYRHGNMNAPVREYTATPQYKAFQNTKYADKMKWCILMENASTLSQGSPEQNLDAFLKYLAPYWIEYFFKDPNYYKIDGRPVIGFYYFWAVQGDFTSDTKAGIDKFRQLCIDAGVGNPIFLVDRDVPSDGSETHLKQMETWGVDMHSMYHQGGKYFEETKEALIAQKEMVKRNNFSFQSIPVISPGFDDYAWGRSTGVKWDNEQMKKGLEFVRDEFFDDMPTPLGRKILQLSTWDEYAEGHYFAPTESTGFDFLDIVRDTFVGGEHTDILPTEHQMDRFNNRYPSWREAPYIHEPAVGREIPENTYVKKAWTFDTPGDTEGWIAKEGLSSVEIKDGCLKAISSGGRAMLDFNAAGEEHSDVVQIRVKYKNPSSAYLAKLWYKNQFMDEIKDTEAIREHMNQYGEGELVFSTERYYRKWRGMLETMQLSFQPMNASEEIYIDSIEMIAKKPDESKIKLSINGYVTETDGIVVGEDDAMIPIRDLAWALKFDDRVYYEAATDTVKYRSYSDNLLITMPLGSDKFTINGEEYESAKYYNCIDGICRVSTAWVTKVFGKDSFYDPDTKTFYIVDKRVFVPERNVEDRELIWGAEFESGMDGFVFGQDTSGSVSGGECKLRTVEGDPQFINYGYLESKGIDCSNVKAFAIKTTLQKPIMLKVYFSTTTHTAVSESNAFYFNLPASEESRVYFLDISKWVNWEGILTYMRIDVEEEKDNSLDIDWIRLYGDYEVQLSNEELANLYSSIETTDNSVEWNFNINNSIDGWKFNKAVANIDVQDGVASMDVIGRNPEMMLCGNVDYVADEIKEFRIGMSAPRAKYAKMYFITDSDTTYSEDKSFILELSTDKAIYTVKPQNNSAWKGYIKGLKFIPTDSMGKLSIDFIRMIK